MTIMVLYDDFAKCGVWPRLLSSTAFAVKDDDSLLLIEEGGALKTTDSTNWGKSSTTMN